MKNKELKKDTIFPVKFHKILNIREIELFQSICSEFAKNTQTELSFISFSAVAKRLQTTKQPKKQDEIKSLLHQKCFNFGCTFRSNETKTCRKNNVGTHCENYIPYKK